MSGSAAALIEFDNVTLSFNDQPLYQGIDLSVREGEFLCLLGPSGCGKSTMLRLMSGLMEPTGGAISIAGKSPREMRDKFAFVFQNPRLVPWRNALDNVSLAAGLRFGKSRKAVRERAREELRKVDLDNDMEKTPAMLSGGEQQRVAIARALMVDPHIVLMDEPFSALDIRTRGRMRKGIEKLWLESGKTVVFVTHDIDDAISLADRVVVFSAKPTRIVEIVEIQTPRPRRQDDPQVDLSAIRSRLSERLHDIEAHQDADA